MKIKHSNKKLNSKKEEKTLKDFKKELNYDKDIEEDCFERNNKVKDNRYDYLEDELALNLDNNKKILSQNIIKTTNFCPKRNLVDSNNNKNKNNPQKKKSTYKKDDKELKLKISNISDNLLITDLDEFFRNIYEYYYNKGFNNILTQTILDNTSYLFSIHFMVINIFIIDWREIIFECKTNNACSSEITQYFTKDKIMNNLIKYRIYFSIFYTSFIIYYLIFLIKSIILLRNMKFIKKIYDTKLKIKQSEMEDLRFDTVLTKLISLQRTEGFCRIKENITKFDIVSRIMRQENYLIALFSNGLIDTKINFCFNLKLPFCKTEIYKKKFGIDLFSNFFYTKLNESVINFAFGTNDKSLNKDFINLKSLRLKLFIFMIFEIIFLFPFVFLKFIFWIFKNADNLKSDKKTIFSQKNWNKKIQIFFKNYNELQHYFDYRMINSNHYLNCFNNCFKYKEKLFNIFKKFLKLIFGSILILIFFLSFSDSRLLTDLNIFGKNFVWIGIMVGIILSLTEEKNIQETKENPYLMISEDDSLSNDNHSPENKFDGDNRQFYYKKLLNCLINIPKEWPKNFEYFSKINKKINNYHELTIITIIKEIFATVFFPIIWIKLIIQAEKIRQFILQNSVEIQGIGTICSFSYFNFYNFKKQREKKDTFIEFNFNDKKFFNSSFYFRNIYYRSYMKTNDRKIIKSQENEIYNNQKLSKSNYNNNDHIDISSLNDEEIIVDYTNNHGLNNLKNKSLADFEKENGIYIENIKCLEKKIFKYFEKKCYSNINFNQKFDNKTNFYDQEIIGPHPEENENLSKIIEYKDDEGDNYLNILIYDEENLEHPSSKKDLEDNFFYYTSKIHLLNEFDKGLENNPFMQNVKKNCEKDSNFNKIPKELMIQSKETKLDKKFNDKICDFTIDKIERNLKDIHIE